MIDLATLERAAREPDGTVRVTASWLKQALAELTEARAVKARPRCFGLPSGTTL